MEYLKHDLDIGDPTKWIDLHFISDVHKGAAGHNDKAFAERIESIRKNPRAVWFGVGDLGDYIFYSDPRFSMSAIPNVIEADELRQGIFGQIRKIATALEPIVDKCIGVGSGNHEEKIAQRYHVDPTRELSYRLKVPYIGYSALTMLRMKAKFKSAYTLYTARIFTHHGFGGGRRHGPQINKVEDCLRLHEADIYALAHVHGKVASKLIIGGINTGGNKTESLKTFIVTGSYQDSAPKGTVTYAERMAFPKSPYGSPTVRIRWTGNKHRLETQVVL